MYIHESGALFHDVQTSGIFTDSKTFPDCLPKAPLHEIVALYEKEKITDSFDLKHFVFQHFDLPAEPKLEAISSDGKSIEAHLGALWPLLTRQPDQEKSSLLPLPYAYVVPGGRFREIYYWDSYFTMLGLQVSGRMDLVESMANNFAHLVGTLGFIPNGNRAYYAGRSQPPFFSLIIKLLQETKGDSALSHYLPFLEEEYRFWMRGTAALSPETNAAERVVRMPDGSLLNRYWDAFDTPRPEAYKEDLELAAHSSQAPGELFRHIRAAAESGWDFSTRWFADGLHFATINTTDIVPVDLNCLLWHLEKMIAGGCFISGRIDDARQLEQAAENRRAAIQQWCWDEASGFYFDYDLKKQALSNRPCLAAVFPLFFQLADENQALKTARFLEQHFLQNGGLSTTLVHSGQQWDAPNGWAPLQWMAFAGLKNYGLPLAEVVRYRWLSLNRTVFEKTGKMTEKYNVFEEDLAAGGGEYPNQDGFGWTNGVFLAMAQHNYD